MRTLGPGMNLGLLRNVGRWRKQPCSGFLINRLFWRDDSITNADRFAPLRANHLRRRMYVCARTSLLFFDSLASALLRGTSSWTAMREFLNNRGISAY